MSNILVDSNEFEIIESLEISTHLPWISHYMRIPRYPLSDGIYPLNLTSPEIGQPSFSFDLSDGEKSIGVFWSIRDNSMTPKDFERETRRLRNLLVLIDDEEVFYRSAINYPIKDWFSTRQLNGGFRLVVVRSEASVQTKHFGLVLFNIKGPQNNG